MLPSSLALFNKETESFVCMAQKSVFWRKCKREKRRGSKTANFLGREVAGEKDGEGSQAQPGGLPGAGPESTERGTLAERAARVGTGEHGRVLLGELPLV